MLRQIVLSAAVAAMLLAGAGVSAHHGAGAYDRSQSVTVKGTVTRFDFINPHVLIYIAASGPDGRDVVWSGELTSPNRLARMGGPTAWHKDLLKPGDVITLTGNPASNGAPVMLISRVEDEEGHVLTGRGR